MFTPLHPLTGLSRIGVRGRRFLGSTDYDAFEGIIADSDELVAECLRARHRIDRVERNLLPALEHASELETDEYDHGARHGLLRYRRTGEAVGAVRLVLPEPAAGDRGLPMYAMLRRLGCSPADLPPIAQTAEVLRFAIAKDFRRGCGEDRSMIPHMALGLMAMAVRMSAASGSRYLCALMEPTLIRLLARFGIHWEEVGPQRSSHGLGQPCVAEVGDLAATVAAERPDVWEFMTHPAAPAGLRRGGLWQGRPRTLSAA